MKCQTKYYTACAKLWCTEPHTIKHSQVIPVSHPNYTQHAFIQQKGYPTSHLWTSGVTLLASFSFYNLTENPHIRIILTNFLQETGRLAGTSGT